MFTWVTRCRDRQDNSCCSIPTPWILKFKYLASRVNMKVHLDFFFFFCLVPKSSRHKRKILAFFPLDPLYPTELKEVDLPIKQQNGLWCWFSLKANMPSFGVSISLNSSGIHACKRNLMSLQNCELLIQLCSRLFFRWEEWKDLG